LDGREFFQRVVDEKYRIVPAGAGEAQVFAAIFTARNIRDATGLIFSVA
jgi:hypothetical protein